MAHVLVVIRCQAQPVISELVADVLRRAAPDFEAKLLIAQSATPSVNELVDADAILVVGAALDLPAGSPPTLCLAPETILTDPSRALVSAMALLGDKVRDMANGLAEPLDTENNTRNGSADLADPYHHLLTGVSFMLPFVVAGGLIVALAFCLEGLSAGEASHRGTLGWSLIQIGGKGAFVLMVPVLAGYIAYSLAGRPGIAPGMVGGMIAANMAASFLGGIVAGFIAGYGTAWLARRLHLPRHLQGLIPIVLLPFLGTLATGLIMVYVIGAPVAFIMETTAHWLTGMQSASALLLGSLIGLMTAFDLGGPMNKTAYAFGTTLIGTNVCGPITAAMAAGMTPPLGVSLATWWFGDRFSEEERHAGKATAILGMAFMTEGAIPFAARDPLRVMPALMAGSALTGALTMAMASAQCVPHGEVFTLPFKQLVSQPLMFAANVALGCILTALMLRALKRKAS
ncbi:PTS fructose transporter subunit IIC [Paludibacterium purpuratum]|uniref:Fructose-specific phosphotransferase system IIC component n=1 Tax=Paludibacterium purpuratum TaxID=1144873 RepID=A0A4R7B5B1_9NEIS|nr:fructose-specific PTS transporter subunit EIIC [Paludibacterium purpuratum]TDR79798.1 fructose-specific phosphotransferase system IIC component [Paludibacterium purpuratum]